MPRNTLVGWTRVMGVHTLSSRRPLAAALRPLGRGRQQRIADALGKNSAIILPTALDGGQRPFGLFGIDRAFWRGRSALKRDALATSLLERLLPDWSIPLGAVYWLTPPAGPPPKCSRRGRPWIALAKEGEEVWKNWKAPEWRNAPAPMRREHPDCPAIPTRRLRRSL